MKFPIPSVIPFSLFVLMLGIDLTLAGDEGAQSPPSSVVRTGSLLDTLHLFGSSRLRYEYGEQSSLDESTLGSLRTRFGLKTDRIAGFEFLAEGEHMWVLTDSGSYRAFPPPGGQTIIADPDNFQLNRLQLSYLLEPIATEITVGRQLITRADQRFIGAVGWRQNDQIFDAVVIENKSLDDVTFSYAYLDQVNRIFGSNAPASALESWESNSHLLDLTYTGIEDHTVRAFAYLLDFDNSLANSVNTYGLEVAGVRDLSGSNELNYLLTAAMQEDGNGNPADYREFYFRGEMGFKNGVNHFGVGAEMMTSDGVGGRFRFPLGTNHKFNGFADAFLTTPVNGLVDTYAWIGTEAIGMKHTLAFHHYRTEEASSDLGWEVDYVASKKLCDSASLLFKGAFLDGKGAQADITRATVEINYTF
jgi:hypothetical protein